MGSVPATAIMAHGGAHSDWDWATAIGHWHADAVTVAALAAALAAYLAGVRRVRNHGGSWPAGRVVAMVGGSAVVAVGLLSGLASYETTLFSAHAAQHLLVGMVAPLLVVLAAPFTLALRAAPAGARPVMHRIVGHPVTGVLGHPVTGLVVFGATLVALYFTPLYELTLRNDAVHLWLHAHLFVAGILLTWPLVGIAPLPVRASHVGRLMVVVVSVPVHAFIAVALMTATTPLAVDHYAAATGRSPAEILADQRTGAGLLWAAGELMALAMVGIVVARWLSSEQRIAERVERLEPARTAS